MAVDLVRNLDTSDRLCNGSTGTVQGWADTPDYGTIVWVVFADPRAGERRRGAQAAITQRAQADHPAELQQLHPLAVPIHRMMFDVTSRDLPCTIRRHQHPLRPAAARTLNRAQGQSMDKLAVSFKYALISTAHDVQHHAQLLRTALHFLQRHTCLLTASCTSCPSHTHAMLLLLAALLTAVHPAAAMKVGLQGPLPSRALRRV